MNHKWPEPSERDVSAVQGLLGRSPEGLFTVVARSKSTDQPAVIACWPIINSNRPMPTLFWLLDPLINRQVSSLEAGGIIKKIRMAIDLTELDDAHLRYAGLRDRLIPSDYDGPRPSGGIGGTRGGFKCLHAHVAWFLISGNDPAVNWVLTDSPDALSLEGIEFLELPAGLESVREPPS